MKRSILWMLIIVVSISVVAVFSFTGCKVGSAAEEAIEEAVEEVAEAVEEAVEEEMAEEEAPAMDLTFGYISKFLTHPWFIA